MSRAPDAVAMLDIRSAAILQDMIFASNPCAPGANLLRKPPYQFYGPTVLESNKKKFDTKKSWVACIAAAVITGTILGIVHSFGIILPFLNQSYNVGQVEAIIVGAMTYAVLIFFGPISCCLIKCIGQRLTCIFGMLLFFMGLMIDAFAIHRMMFFVTHIVLMGIGGSLAYSSAMSFVVDHFRKSLPLAIIVLSVSSPIGTAIFYTLSDFLIKLFPENTSYRWMQLVLSIIVLVMIAATHVFPTRLPRHPDPFSNTPHPPRAVKVKECIEDSYKPTKPDPCLPAPTPETDDDDQKSCMCVIVLDVSVWTDMSFLLWALISLCAMLSIYIPYLFLVKYAMDTVSPMDGDTRHLIWWFCLASFIGRIATLLGNDYTFSYNRSLFQGALIGSGILYLFVVQAKTFGWITVWALAVGVLEGVFSTVIPRVTLQTIPRKWMASSWSYVIVLHGFGILIGPLIVITAWAGTGGFYGVGFVVIGIAQIIAGLLAFILPNEENEEAPEDPLPQGPSALPPLKPDSYYFGPNSYAKKLASYRNASNFGNSTTFSSAYSVDRYDWQSNCSPSIWNKTGMYSFNASTAVSTFSDPCCTSASLAYATNCPICSKVGCVPGCCQYMPGSPGISGQNPGFLTGALQIGDPCLEMSTSLTVPVRPSPSSQLKTSPFSPSKDSVKQNMTGGPQPGPSSDGTVKRVNFEIRHKAGHPTNTSTAPPAQRPKTPPK